jgi:hypothetical protein
MRAKAGDLQHEGSAYAHNKPLPDLLWIILLRKMPSHRSTVCLYEQACVRKVRAQTHTQTHTRSDEQDNPTRGMRKASAVFKLLWGKALRNEEPKNIYNSKNQPMRTNARPTLDNLTSNNA